MTKLAHYRARVKPSLQWAATIGRIAVGTRAHSTARAHPGEVSTVNDDMHRYDKLILVLALVPAVFGALFQGG